MSDDLLGDPDDLFEPDGRKRERDRDRADLDDRLEEETETMGRLGRNLKKVFDDE